MVALLNQDTTAEREPRSQPISARRLLLHLIGFYLAGSGGAVVITLFLALVGLEFTLSQWIYLLLSVVWVVPVYLLLDVYVIRRHYRPLGETLTILDSGQSPDNWSASRAMVRALNLPFLSFVRVTFIHGPAASALVVLALWLGNVFADAGYANWQLAAFGATILFFASPTHAIIEFFVIARAITPVVERLWDYCDRVEAAHRRELISINLRNKLLYLSIFVAALPLLFFAASIIPKVDLLFNDLGYEISLSQMSPLLLWVSSVVLVCMGGALAMSILTASDVSRSAARLIDAMKQVENGELDNRLKIAGTDEYAELYRGFNLMTESLREEVQILELSHDLAGELDLDRLLARIIGATTELLDAERSSLLLFDSRNGELWSRVAEGLETREIRLPADQGIAGAVFTSGLTENITDPYADPRFNKQTDQQTGFKTRSILCMPIVNKAGEKLGVTQVLNKRGDQFRARDEQRLAAFTAQIAVALENARLFEDVLNEKNYNDSILKSTSNGVLTFDEDHKILVANEMALTILQANRDAFIGKSVESVFGDKNQWVMTSLARVEQTGQADSHVDAELALPDGQTASVNMSVMPLVDSAEETIGSMMMIEDITSEKRVRSTMSRYMSAEVVEELLSSGGAQLGGQNQHVSILFSDLRGFTTVSETLGARDTVSMLNEYFEEMVEVIFQNAGVLDKFIGDAIMALYGVPFNGEQDADNAVTTANGMFTALRILNTRRAGRGMAPMDIGIGISTGDVVVGNIGSTRRMEYTVIGDSVNLAARLEGATKYYGAHVLLSEFTVADLKQSHLLREIDLMRVKGKNKPVIIFEAMDHHTDESFVGLEAALAAYNEAFAAVKQRDWKTALAGFESVLSINPQDRPSVLHRDRVLHYRDNPPPDDWDGVWVMESK
ncbi:MAG: GAF domain-containing protein [Alphaproteobacteria bacterium]|nr:GAF domain-containing protein [Alphaproteobacteria bacterium]